jgi:hypothetical protein
VSQIPILTQMRQAVVDALENYLPLRKHQVHIHLFNRRGEAEHFTPDVGRLPMISVEPLTIESPWSTNQGQLITYEVNVSLWTAHLELQQFEAFWQLVHLALWRSKPNDSDPRSYIDRVVDECKISFAPSTLGMGNSDKSAIENGTVPKGVWMCYSPIKVSLKKEWDPLHDDEAALTDLIFVASK